MTKELIKKKIEILQGDLAMLIEGSVASDSLAIEIEDLKRQLKTLEEVDSITSQRD